MANPKLIVLTGFAASGKSTIARKYINEHSLALALEADAFVDNIGDWANNREESRTITYELIKSAIRAYLSLGHDVILPYLITDYSEFVEFEKIAQGCDADYFEILLKSNRDQAIDKLLTRGKWGGATSPPVTRSDLPVVEQEYDRMQSAINQRPAIVSIDIEGFDPDETYEQLIRNVE